MQEGHRSLGLITTDCDDVSYAALDEATKKADVSVAYARSMYAGSSNAMVVAGEFIGILSGENPEDVKSGLAAAVSYIENDACFYSANNDDSIVYFAQCISRTGSYPGDGRCAGRNGNGLSDRTAVGSGDGTGCGVESGRCGNEPVLWATYRANFAGGLLTGDQAACRAACEAFRETICRIAEHPVENID